MNENNKYALKILLFSAVIFLIKDGYYLLNSFRLEFPNQFRILSLKINQIIHNPIVIVASVIVFLIVVMYLISSLIAHEDLRKGYK